jgi:hypothetical protein
VFVGGRLVGGGEALATDTMSDMVLMALLTKANATFTCSQAAALGSAPPSHRLAARWSAGAASGAGWGEAGRSVGAPAQSHVSPSAARSHRLHTLSSHSLHL